jgi:hypothetical protein
MIDAPAAHGRAVESVEYRARTAWLQENSAGSERANFEVD